jgi:hypothetical protein
MNTLLTSTGGPTTVIRVRRGQATTSGTLLGQSTYLPAMTNAGYTNAYYVKNNSGSDISTKLSATVQHFTVGATASLYGDAQQPMYVLAEDAGSIADQGFASFAIEI